MTQKLTISLEPRHLDIIMGSLSEQPFKIVAGTVGEINRQIAAQMQQGEGNTASDRVVELQAKTA